MFGVQTFFYQGAPSIRSLPAARWETFTSFSLRISAPHSLVPSPSHYSLNLPHSLSKRRNIDLFCVAFIWAKCGQRFSFRHSPPNVRCSEIGASRDPFTWFPHVSVVSHIYSPPFWSCRSLLHLFIPPSFVLHRHFTCPGSIIPPSLRSQPHPTAQ